MVDNVASDSTFFYVLGEAVHILFVDDDPIMREFAAVHLSSDDGRVSLAGDGEAALAAVAADMPDVMLLDLEMPTLTRLRADPRTAHLPVIVVTGREDVVAIDRAFNAGATSFLVKPINWRLLTYQVRYVRRANQAERTLNRLQAAATEAVDAQLMAMEVMRGAAELIHQAAQGGPLLRRTALDYAALISDIYAPTPVEKRSAA